MNPVVQELRDALTAEDTVIDQAVAYIGGEPARLQAAFDAGAAGDNATLQAMKDDVIAHGLAITNVLPAATPTTPAVPLPAAA